MSLARSLVVAAVAGVVSSALASPVHAQIGGCAVAPSAAVEGNYTGRASFAIRATGNVEMIQFMPTSIDGDVALSGTVDRRGNVEGTATGQGTSGLVARSPGGISRHSRQDSGSGTLRGALREGQTLEISGGMAMTLRVTSVSCGSARGTVDTGSGLVSELASGWRGAGLAVTFPNALWELGREGRDPALESQVDSMVNQLGSVTDPAAPSTAALIRSAMALGVSLTPGPDQPRDPYRECLGQRLIAAAGPVQARRADHFLAPFRSRVVNAPLTMAQWQDALRELRLAAMFGCETDAELRLLIENLRRMTDRRAREGASARELIDLLRLQGFLGMIPDALAAIARCNDMARSAGHAPPFRAAAR